MSTNGITCDLIQKNKNRLPGPVIVVEKLHACKANDDVKL